MEVNMLRYIRLTLHFWKASVMRRMELRFPFLANLLNSAAALFLNIVFFQIIYSHVESIAGWSKYEVFFLLGIFHFFFALVNMAIRPGISQLEGLVRSGDLDGLLIKPISSQFLISFREIDIFRIFDGILGLILISYSLFKLSIIPTFGQWLLAILHLILSLIIVYAIWYISLTIVIWTTALWSWVSLTPNIFFFGQYPADIYKGKIRLLFLTVCPIIVVANFPAKTLLGKLSWHWVGYTFLLAVIFLTLSILFWKKALRFYSSASS